MIDPAWCQLMARYNRWMNERLYAVVATLPDEERHRNVGAFFRSIHGTLAHLVWADRTWLARFTGTEFFAPAWGQDWIDDFARLSRMRDETDQAVSDWTDRLDAEWLRSPLRYVAKSDGKSREVVGWSAAAHFFNHQTHHRGQVTTLLSQLGVDPGVTDLAQLPGVTRLVP
jgi:uncharacterized damage-inducible protein DinB